MSVGTPASLAALSEHRALRLGTLRGLARFLEGLTDASGVLVCPRHRVEHTGKNVYAALLNQHLWRYTREEEYLERARRVALRAVDMFGEDPDSRVPIFLPGRVDPRNASTSSIDGGACADVLATLLEEEPGAFDADQTARVREVLEQHVDGYLRHSARERPIPAQRLWAATGVARAARLAGRDDWREDALAGCRLALAELHEDGVAPYVPAHARDCSHPGLAETSGFYHSRTPAFVLYVHEVLDAPLDADARAALGRSLEALLALFDGRGRKVVQNEAKPWYWESGYEVASHPFDVYALVAGAALLQRPTLLEAAGQVMEEWLAHVGPDGGVHSHHGRGTNFQCRVFWTAHAAWIARVLGAVPVTRRPRERLDVDLPASGVLHVERERYTAVLRGRRRPHSNLFGCDQGGGRMQSLVVHDPSRPAGRELIERPRWSGPTAGDVSLLPRARPSLVARLREVVERERADLRFRLYVASVEWRAGARVHALGYPLRHVVARTLRDATGWTSSRFDLLTEQHWDGRRARFVGALADRYGRPLAGTRTERVYAFDEDAVRVEERLELDGVHGRARYEVPRAWRDVQAHAEGAALRARAGGRRFELDARGGRVVLVVRGSWHAAAPSRPRRG